MILLIWLAFPQLHAQSGFPAWMAKDSLFKQPFDVRIPAYIAAFSSPGCSNFPPCPESAQGPLAGLKIALDPGHAAINPDEALIEFKFVKAQINDSTRFIYEAELNRFTARLLADTLRSLGACVFISDQKPIGILQAFLLRNNIPKLCDCPSDADSSSFPTPPPLISDPKTFYHSFYKYADMWLKARRINSFSPHITISLHLNVEEKNKPERNGLYSLHNQQYAMVFVPGAYLRREWMNSIQRSHFYRQLQTRSPERALPLAILLIESFHQHLNIPPVAEDASLDYLKNGSVRIHPGVYARNLYFLRQIESPAILTEPLLQDEKSWFLLLSQKDCEYAGQPFPCALKPLVSAYTNAILKWWSTETGNLK